MMSATISSTSFGSVASEVAVMMVLAKAESASMNNEYNKEGNMKDMSMKIQLIVRIQEQHQTNRDAKKYYIIQRTRRGANSS